MTIFIVESKFKVIQIELISNGITLQCSLWHSRGCSPPNCLIYLHSAGMNQFEALNIVPYIVNEHISLFAFDFPGCGKSSSELLPFDGNGPSYVMSCARYLHRVEKIEKFALWGRSMGAAIALHTVSLYSDSFSSIVSDSAFSDLDSLINDQLKSKGCPKLLIKSIKKYFKKKVNKFYHEKSSPKIAKEKSEPSNFKWRKKYRVCNTRDVPKETSIKVAESVVNDEVDEFYCNSDDYVIRNNKVEVDFCFPLSCISKATVPLLIGHGNQDRYVPPSHGQRIFKSYGSMNKQLYTFDAVHFKSRPYYWYDNAVRFIYKHINVRPRFYEFVYGGSNLHIGDVDTILRNLCAVRTFEVTDVSDDDEDDADN